MTNYQFFLEQAEMRYSVDSLVRIWKETHLLILLTYCVFTEGINYKKREIWGVNRGVVECLGFLECKVLSLNDWVLPFFWEYLTLGK